MFTRTPGRPNGLAAKLAVLLAGLAIGLLVLELALRLLSTNSLTIRYLATAGTQGGPKVFENLEEFLASRIPPLQPHSPWQGYFTNALGFNDQEFLEQKPSEIFRIAAIGDSFCFGLLGYPFNVQTVVQGNLRKARSGSLEVYNFGVPAIGAWEYLTMTQFVLKRYNPDLISVHLYLGNDPPDLLNSYDDLSPWKKQKTSSYLLGIVRNLYKIKMLAAPPSMPLGSVDSALTLHQGGSPAADFKRSEIQSPYSEAGYAKVMTDELGRFYIPKDVDVRSNKLWTRFLEVLDLIVELTKRTQTKLIFVFYPSRLQLEGSSHNDVSRIVGSGQLPTDGKVDFHLPNRILLEFCRTRHLECIDLTDGMLRFAQTESLYLDRDPHWNILGNQRAGELEAAAISSYLRQVSLEESTVNSSS